MGVVYKVEWDNAEVLLQINDPDVIERVIQNKEGYGSDGQPTGKWKEVFYDISEAYAVEMLARCCGVMRYNLSDLDGWGDCPDLAITILSVEDNLWGTNDAELESEDELGTGPLLFVTRYPSRQAMEHPHFRGTELVIEEEKYYGQE